jgi:hypothetical protein
MKKNTSMRKPMPKKGLFLMKNAKNTFSKKHEKNTSFCTRDPGPHKGSFFRVFVFFMKTKIKKEGQPIMMLFCVENCSQNTSVKTASVTQQ